MQISKLISKIVIMALVTVIPITFSGCIEEEKVTSGQPHKEFANFSHVNLTLSAYEKSNNISENHNNISENHTSYEENKIEIKLRSFSNIYARNNQNKNLRPVFNWEDVPGSDSYKFREYLRHWGYYYDWVENATIIKTEEYLFNWDGIPGYDNHSLNGFLVWNFDLDWAEKIEKSDDGMTINVSGKNDNFSIRLNSEKTRATLTSNNSGTQEFVARMENGRLNIYNYRNYTIQVIGGGNSIKITLVPGKKALLWNGNAIFEMPLETGSVIQFPVKEENGKNIIYDAFGFYGHQILEQHYVVYNLSIKNTGLNAFDFELKKLNLHIGDRVFYPKTSEFDVPSWSGRSERFKVEYRIADTILLPGQSINGSVFFSVDSPYNKSFLLTYNTTPVNLSYFEKSIEALTEAELFNYSAVVGKPPYHADNYESPYSDTYNPPEPEYYSKKYIAYPLIWPNWVNRSVVEFYKKLDLMELNRYNREDDLPQIILFYSIKAIPEKNITMFTENQLIHLVDDTGEEIIGESRIEGMAILKGKTYEIQPANEYGRIDFPQMTFSNVTVVIISFDNYYGWSMASRMNYNDQTVVIDENKNIIAALYHYARFVS